MMLEASQPECRRVGHLQIERNALADVQAAADCFIVVHVSLLKWQGHRNRAAARRIGSGLLIIALVVP